MRPEWLLLASLVPIICTFYTFSPLVQSLIPGDSLLRIYSDLRVFTFLSFHARYSNSFN